MLLLNLYLNSLGERVAYSAGANISPHVAYSVGGNFTPHVFTVNAGEVCHYVSVFRTFLLQYYYFQKACFIFR